MKSALKDQLILLAIHPEKGWVRQKSVIGNVLLAAALIDLTLQSAFKIDDGKIGVNPFVSDDPVYSDLLAQISAMQGKKFSWLITKLSIRTNKYFNMQMNHLESRRLISSSPVEWLGITWGKRYRVTRGDSLKPIIYQMERTLIYGRKPDLNTRFLIEFLGLLDLLGVFFVDKEFRTKARKQYFELSKLTFESDDETLQPIFKELHSVMKRHTAAMKS